MIIWTPQAEVAYC